MIVISYVIVRVFHLSSWGGRPLFREPAELQSPMEVSTLPAPLFTAITDYTVMVLRSNSNSFVMDTAPRGEGLGIVTAEEAESSVSSSVYSPQGETPCWRALVQVCG